jgi:hypothetical protein
MIQKNSGLAARQVVGIQGGGEACYVSGGFDQ